MTQALRLSGVHLTLNASSGPVHILKGVDLEVNQGEVVGIIGPSGSGKSSLIAVGAGLERPNMGAVELLGQDLAGQDEDALARLRRGRISLVFQSFHLIPTMSAFDNVRAPLEIARLDRVDERAAAALEDVGLSSRLRHYPGQLSGGERQRVAVARALASDPKLVFADEPTGNLDTETGETVANHLFEIARRRQASLVLVTHDTNLASRADRVLRMNAGRLES